jgi:antitoxin (DNA-binding transcriptional repressor) of toxin-antitoxin stability system
LADHSVKEKPAEAGIRATPSGSRLVLTVGAGACAALLLVVPRAVPPRELPPLVLDPAACAEVEARDATLRAPESELVDRIRSGVEAQGRAEVSEGEPTAAYEQRLAEVRAAARALVEAEGEESLDALRAEALRELPRALSGELSRDEEAARLGSFPRMLERYGATRDGEVVAPAPVVRALFAARWDAIVRGDPTARLSPVERQAYWGWLALGDRPVPAELRLRALRETLRAGGWGAREAAAIAAREAGQRAEAEARYAELAADGNLRLRNAALALE